MLTRLTHWLRKEADEVLDAPDAADEADELLDVVGLCMMRLREHARSGLDLWQVHSAWDAKQAQRGRSKLPLAAFLRSVTRRC
jgi:RecB family endonuclease NucS